MKRGIVLILFLFGCFALSLSQESVLKEINTTLSGKKKQVKRENGVPLKYLKNKGDTSKNEFNDLSNLLRRPDSLNFRSKDSLRNLLLGVEGDISQQEVDTQLFQQRMVDMKKPLSPKSLHSEQEWSKELMITNNVKYSKKHVLDTSYKVFGWHPYWCGDAYKSYNFSLLSMVSYFSYEVNPKTGFYTTIHNWRKTPLVDSAKKNNCKVLLSVTNFGTENNRIFLRTPDAQKNLIATAITLIRERGANGLTIDFENVRSEEKQFFTNFIIDLSTSLKAESEDYMLTLAIPAVDFEKVYDFNQINLYVDLYIMMGYEYHGVNSKVAGPVAPLSNGNKWNGFTLENSVDEYLVNGVPPKRFLLGLPYYGAEWVTKDLKFPSPAKSFVKYYSYRQAKRIAGKYNGAVDNTSLSKFYAYSDVSYNYKQLWFEDSTTLGAKYDWVKEKQIGGIGIWALGYDNGHDELWKLIANRFSYNEEELKAIKKNRRKISFRRMFGLFNRLLRNPKSLISRPRPFITLFGSLAGISLVGLFILFRYSHRFKRVFKLIMQGSISAIIILTIALLFIFFRYFQMRELFFLFGGFLIGLILFFLFSRRYISEKDLP